MEKLLSPAVRLMDKLMYPQKFLVISLVFLALILGLIVVLARGINNRMELDQKEIIGIQYVKPVMRLLIDVQKHRVLTYAYHNGVKHYYNDILEQEKLIENDIKAVDKVNNEYGKILGTTQKWNEIKSNWKSIRGVNSIAGDTDFELHTRLIDRILGLITLTGQTSNLLLDSEVETYYLIDVVINQIPPVIEGIEKARGLATGIAAQKSVTPDQRKQLIILYGTARLSLSRMLTSLDNVIKHEPSLKSKLNPYIENVDKSTYYFLDLMNSRLIDTNVLTIQPYVFFDAGDRAINANYDLFTICIQSLDNLLHDRIHRLETYKALLLFSVLAVLLLSLYLFSGFYLSVIGSIITLQQTTRRVAEGNLDARAKVTARDEMGNLAESLNLMIEDLENLFAREKFLRELILYSMTSLDLHDVLLTIVTQTGKYFKADRCFIAELDEKSNEFLPVKDYEAYVGSDNIMSVVGSTITAKTAPYMQQILQTREVMVVNDINKLDIPESAREIYNKFNVKSFILAPIYYGNTPLGILVLDYATRYRKFSQSEINLFDAISGQAAIIIQQAIIYNKMLKTSERERLLRGIILASISSTDIKDTLKTIVTQTGKALQADRCFFVKYDPVNLFTLPLGSYQEYIASPDLKTVSERIHLTAELAPLAKILIEQRQDIIVNNANETDFPEETKLLLQEYNIKSFIGTPIFYGDKPLGALVLHYVHNYKSFSEDDISFLTAIGNQSAIVINQAQLINDIQNAKNRESLLMSINNEILTSDNLNQAINNITTQLLTLLDADRANFRFFDSTNRTFSNLIGESRKNENIPSLRDKTLYLHAIDEETAREAIDKNQFWIINNSEDPKYPETVRSEFKGVGTKSLIIAPVVYKNIPIGIVAVASITAFRTWRSEEIDLLHTVISQISTGISLFLLTDRLGKALNAERSTREIILEVRKLESHDQIFNYVLDKMCDVFKVDRAVHLHFDSCNTLRVENEVVKSDKLTSIIGEKLCNISDIQEVVVLNPDKVVVIDNVSDQIRNPHFKEYLLERGINSFLTYPVAIEGKTRENIWGIIMLCSVTQRNWSMEDIDTFKLIVDVVTIIYAEIKQRMEVDQTRKTFLATLTHDLRSPINAEQKALEFIISRTPETRLDSFKEFLEDIYKTNNELLRIVNNILLTYHYEAGRYELNVQLSSTYEIICDAVKSMKSLAVDMGSEITTDIQLDLPPIMLDRDEITRVVVNLLDNAIKHNKRGTDVTVSARRCDHKIKVSVSDNGVGIPEEERKNIFQRYPTTKRKIGTGLGLFLCKQIVDAHHGKIWFDTEIGKGTTFSFTLPYQ